MEPFNLSLQQVNFEEKDITEDDALDSFSNLVYFESDFKHGKSDALPVVGRNLSFLSTREPNKKRAVYSSPYDSGEEVFATKHHLVGSITTHAGSNRRHGDTMAIQPTGDSFVGFTDTVEALALQKSVIGSSAVKPASDDEVARAIAEAKLKFLASNDHILLESCSNAVPSDVVAPADDGGYDLVSGDPSTRHEAVITQYRQHKGKLQPNRQTELGDRALAGSSSSDLDSSDHAPQDAGSQDSSDHAPQDAGSQNPDTESLSSISSSDNPMVTSDALTMAYNEQSGGVTSASNSHVPASPDVYSDSVLVVSDNTSAEDSGYVKQLIHIPADQLTTQVERSSGWFSRNGATKTGKNRKEAKNKTRKSRAKMAVVDGVSEIPANGVVLTGNVDDSDTNGYQGRDNGIPSDSCLHGDVESTAGAFCVDNVDNQQSPAQSPSHNLHNEQSPAQSPAQSPTHSAQSPAQSPTHSAQSVAHSAQSVTHSAQSMTHSAQSVAQSPTHSSHTESRSSTSNLTTAAEVTHKGGATTTHIIDTQHLTSDTSHRVTREVNVTRETLSVPSSVSSRHSSPSKYRRDSPDGDTVRAELDKVLREKAKLEGQLEVLQEESGAVIKERAQLQAQVATLQQQAKTIQENASGIRRERDSMSSDMETLRLNRGRLEQVIMDARKLLEDKDHDIKTLAEDLKLSHAANNKLQQKVADNSAELMGKDTTVQDMKGKIAELYVDFQMSNHNMILAESEIKSLQSDIKSLAVAKEWYQSQLQLSQEAKGALQREVSGVKSEMIAQTTMVERLKADNIHVKQLLTEAEQRALAEKEKLARHLETIESHMMEREATFTQLQQQKESIEATLQLRLESSQQEIPSEVADELKTAHNELRRRQAHIAMLEHEQTDLVKRLTLSQESILERDKTIESVGRKSVDTEIQLQQVALLLRERDDEFAKLKDEMSCLEVESSTLREEKLTISSALLTLKTDMGKVESSFKHLKNELRMKQEEIGRLKDGNSKLTQELEASHRETQVARVHGNLTNESLQTRSDTRSTGQDDGERTDTRSAGQDDGERTDTRSEAQVGPDVGPDSQGSVETSSVADLRSSISMLEAREAETGRRLDAVRTESALLIQQLKTDSTKLEQRVAELTGEMEQRGAQLTTEIMTDKAPEETTPGIKALIHSVKSAHKDVAEWSSLTEVERSTHTDQLQDLQIAVEDIMLGSSLTTHDLSLIVRAVLTQNQNIVTILKETQQHKDSHIQESLLKQDSDHQVAIEQLTAKLSFTGDENIKLRQNLTEVTQRSDKDCHGFKQQLGEREQLYKQLETAVSELRVELMGVKVERDEFEGRLVAGKVTGDVTVDLQRQNSDLRSKQAQLETDSHKEIAKQQSKALKLGKDLEATLKTSHQQKHVYETTTAEYEIKLSDLITENARLTEQLQQTQAKFSVDLEEKTTQLQQQLHEVHRHYEERSHSEVELREIVHRHEVDMSSYLTRINELQRDLDEAEGALQQYRDSEEEARNLAIELEREKGRFAGALQSHTTLKEHTSSLEVALAQHESSNVRVNSEISQELDMVQREVTHLTEELEQLHLAYNNEKQNNEDLKKQLLTEKGSHVKVRRMLESLIVEHDQLKMEVEGRQQGVKSLTEELDKVRDSDGKHRSELDHLSHEVKTLREDRDRFFAELEARRNTEPIIQEQIQSLEWQVKEKDTEINAFKEQLSVVEQRQLMETNTLATSLQATKQGMNELRAELISVKDEKTRSQTRIAELKGALQASLQHTKLLQENPGADGSNMTFDLASLENLLQDQTSNTISSKPLSFLQATLSNLRGEITGLQSQVDEHAHAVQTTSQAWRDLEVQVRDLREVCKTSAADRAASQKILAEGAALTGNKVVSGDIN